MQKLMSLILFLHMAGLMVAQTPDGVAGLFMEQLTKYPQEKIYLQTDKSDYLSGERVWLRSHLVEATTNMPAFFSRYIYVEFFSPFDQLVQRIKIRPDSTGVYAGYLDLDEELPQGSYTIRAYTHFMRNRGNEAFFKKSIQVLDPYSLQIDPLPAFSVNENKAEVRFRFMDRASGELIVPDVVTFQLQDETAKQISPGNDHDFRRNFTLSPKKNARVLLLGVVHQGRKYNRYYPIPYNTDDFDVTFHPEGGYLVPDQVCKVGFKAINPSGLSEGITGAVYNSKDEEVVKFSSLRSGMGFFHFTPASGEKYHALCKTENSELKRVDLPVPDSRSRTVSATITDDHRILVSMLRGDTAPDDSVSILVHNKGVVYFHRHWENQSIPYAFVAKNFPTGIISILLLNSKNEILSERLVFNLNAGNFAAVEVGLSSPAYRRRQLVSLRLRLTDSDSIAFADNMAVSVTDKDVVRQDTATSLLGTLLLSSELKGYIESPASYFKGYDIVDREALDALMMTQGWRRYNIPEVLQGNISLPDQFKPEQSQEINGRSEVLFGGLKAAIVSLYATRDLVTVAEVVTADEKGRFKFSVEYPEGTEITVQSLSSKGGGNNQINIDPQTFPDNTFSTIPLHGIRSGQQIMNLDAYLQKADQEYSQKFGIRTIMLDELTVTARSLEKYPDSKFYSPMYATGLITADEIAKRNINSFRSLLIETPGLIVTPNKVTTTRSDKPVIFVIDDIAYDEFYDQMDMVDIGDIETLFVMRDNLGLMGYYPGTEGAVVITTKRGFVQKNTLSRNINKVIPLGYQLPAEFYSPAYETQEQRESSVPDHRTTIFWKPNVQFSGKGEALVEFYAADTPTTYQVVGEGVTSSGKMMRLEKEITIESTY